MLGIPAASRKSSSPALHEARTLLGASVPAHPSKLATVLDRPRSSCSLEEEFGVDPGVATTETVYSEVLNGGGSGGRGLQRLGGHAQVQRILRTRHEYPGVIISAHGTKSADSSWRILEMAAARKGTSPSPLWSFPNLAKGHRDGRRSPRRGQNRRLRMPTRNVVSDQRDTRVCSEGQWPRLDKELAVARSVRHRRWIDSDWAGEKETRKSSSAGGRARGTTPFGSVPSRRK